MAVNTPRVGSMGPQGTVARTGVPAERKWSSQDAALVKAALEAGTAPSPETVANILAAVSSVDAGGAHKTKLTPEAFAGLKAVLSSVDARADRLPPELIAKLKLLAADVLPSGAEAKHADPGLLGLRGLNAQAVDAGTVSGAGEIDDETKAVSLPPHEAAIRVMQGGAKALHALQANPGDHALLNLVLQTTAAQAVAVRGDQVRGEQDLGFGPRDYGLQNVAQRLAKAAAGELSGEDRQSLADAIENAMRHRSERGRGGQATHTSEPEEETKRKLEGVGKKLAEKAKNAREAIAAHQAGQSHGSPLENTWSGQGWQPGSNVWDNAHASAGHAPAGQHGERPSNPILERQAREVREQQHARAQAGHGATGGVRFTSDLPIDPYALTLWLTREAYLENTQDLMFYAEKVRHFNDMKKAIRQHIALMQKMETAWAGVADDKKGETGLNGRRARQGGGGGETRGGSTGSAPTSGAPDSTRSSPGAGGASAAPTIPNADTRLRDFPEQDAEVQRFLGVVENSPGGDDAALEEHIDRHPEDKAKLLAVIPYMTPAELEKLMYLWGGAELEVDGDQVGFWDSMLKAMSPYQLVALGVEMSDYTAIRYTDGGKEFFTRFKPLLAAAHSTLEAGVGRRIEGDDELISAYAKKLQDDEAKVAREKQEAENAASAQAMTDAAQPKTIKFDDLVARLKEKVAAGRPITEVDILELFESAADWRVDIGTQIKAIDELAASGKMSFVAQDAWAAFRGAIARNGAGEPLDDAHARKLIRPISDVEVRAIRDQLKAVVHRPFAEEVAALERHRPNGQLSGQDVSSLMHQLPWPPSAQDVGAFKAFFEKHRARMSPEAAAIGETYLNTVRTMELEQPDRSWGLGIWATLSVFASRAVGGTERGAKTGAEILALTRGSSPPRDQSEPESERRGADGGHGDRRGPRMGEPGSTQYDMDPRNGRIHGVMIVNEPPYIVASGEVIANIAQFEAEKKNLEEKLQSVGDDAQLANVDLQNILQKQQQTLQTMSNMSKNLFDTANSVIRNFM